MIRSLTLAVLISVNAFATNGGTLIGVGPRSTSMGGTGVAHVNGHLDGLYKNPSLLTEKASPSNFNVDLATTYLGLSVNSTVTTPLAAASGTGQSNAKGKLIPDLAVTYRLDDTMALGLGIVPSAGAAFDFSGNTPLSGLRVNHTVAHIQPTFAMTPVENFSFGVSPILGYGELDLNSNATGTQSSFEKKTGVGFTGMVGANYKLDALRFGASYRLPLKIKHKEVTDIDAFGLVASPAADDIEVEQPGELGVGVSFAATPEWTLTFDYRNIAWANANVYEDLGWKSQNVLAFGTQYRINKWAIRAGFNYAKSPVEDASGEVGLTPVSLEGHSIPLISASKLNVIGFPPASQTHITLGGGYDVSDTLGFDLGFMLSPKATITRSGTTTSAAATYAFATEMTQWSITGGVRLGL